MSRIVVVVRNSLGGVDKMAIVPVVPVVATALGGDIRTGRVLDLVVGEIGDLGLRLGLGALEYGVL
jgi:hypothetical protein